MSVPHVLPRLLKAVLSVESENWGSGSCTQGKRWLQKMRRKGVFTPQYYHKLGSRDIFNKSRSYVLAEYFILKYDFCVSFSFYNMSLFLIHSFVLSLYFLSNTKGDTRGIWLTQGYWPAHILRGQETSVSGLYYLSAFLNQGNRNGQNHRVQSLRVTRNWLVKLNNVGK